jgi:dUTP pyrophosphatase
METNKIEDYIKRLSELEQLIDNEGNTVEGVSEANVVKELEDLLIEMNGGIREDIFTQSELLELKFINKSDNPDPSFEKEGDSGFDLRANISNQLGNIEIVQPGTSKLIPTGIFAEVPKGYEVQVRSRSGLAAKRSVMVLNSPGTVDSGYRGEIMIILANFGKNNFEVKHGDRIAQGVVCPVFGEGKLKIIKVESLSESVRNTGGFGHTGVV